MPSAGSAIPDASGGHGGRETAGHLSLGLETGRTVWIRFLSPGGHRCRFLLTVDAAEPQGWLGHRLDIRSQPLGAGI